MSFRLIILLSSFFLFQQPLRAQETPKTLLWRITGNDFTKPCYLYGTMHTKDKRAYYLGDSVYSSIKYCDGFAMEVDVAEFIDTLLTQNENEKLDIEYRKVIENDILQKGPDYYKKRSAEFDSVLVNMRKKFRNMSYRQINRIERAYRRRMRNDMRTRLDLYLFDLAKTQGKVVGAVEDLIDQTSIKDEDDKPFDQDAFVEKQKGRYADFMEWMIETYADAELDKIHLMSKESQSPRMQTIMLYNRNDKMARRIDSLGKIRSTFCAVGCAHLPGDSGVIDLLRKRGFKVEPVFSSKKIEPGEVIIENKLTALTEVFDADSNYMVQMPGRPTDITHITNKLMVRMYKELSNDIFMLCGVFEDGKTYRTVDKVVDEIKDFFSWHQVKLYDAKKIRRQDTDGYEMTFKNPDGYIRMHIFCHSGKTYLFGAGSREKDSMYSVRCDNYLAGYKMFLNRTRSESSFTAFTDTETAFSIAMPSIPKKENIKGELTSTKEQVTLFTSFDTKSKTSYLALVKEPHKGYFPNFDSSIFKITLSEIKNGISQKYAADESNILLDGYPALKLKITGESDSKRQLVHVVMAFRNNRFYCITARGLSIPENEKLFDDYFSSFRFIPYTATTLVKNDNVCNLFSVKALSYIEIPGSKTKSDSIDEKTGEEKNVSEYFAFDSSTATTYSISSIYHGKYYWAENETAFLNEYANFFFNEKKAINNKAGNDSLVYSRHVKNGNTPAKELLLRNIHDGGYTRLRILHYGDSAFVLNMKGDKELLTNAAADSFYNSFRFMNEKRSSNTYSSRTQVLIDDLQLGDSIVSDNAIKALKQGFHFPAPDMPLLLNALLYSYRNTTADVNALIAETITANATDEVPAFIKINYPGLKGKKENIRMTMFNMLAGYKTAASYALLKDFWLNDQPSPANYSTALQLFQSAPALAASFFPELCTKIRDRNMTTDVLDLANLLIDSSKLQYDVLREYEDNILETAKKMLSYYRDNNSEEYYIPNIDAVIKLLVKMNQKKATGLLDDFANLRNYRLNLVIMLALVKSDRQLSTDLIDGFCEDPGRRLILYDELFKIGKQTLFKGKYANQQSLAEAFAVLYTDGEISPRVAKDYEVVAIKEEVLNEKKMRFYVFKVKCHYVYEKISYTCIIGPFEPNSGNLSIQDGKERYILYRYNKYREDEIDTLFNDYMYKIKNLR